MRIALGVLVGMVVGGFLGYLGGVEPACGVFDLGNLCGLVGVFITGPIGTMGGGVAGGYLIRRRPSE